MRPGPVIVIALLGAGVATALFGIWWHAQGPGAQVRQQMELRRQDPNAPEDDPALAPLTRPWLEPPASR